MLNSKTQPQLLLGKNTVYVGAGRPDRIDRALAGPAGRSLEALRRRGEEHRRRGRSIPATMGVMHAAQGRRRTPTSSSASTPRGHHAAHLRRPALQPRPEVAHRLSCTPSTAARPGPRATRSTDTEPPWDVIHYETVDGRPAGHAVGAVQVPAEQLRRPAPDACSLYAVRMEANHKPADAGIQAARSDLHLERGAGGPLARRAQPHAAGRRRLPHRYTINVGGADHPVVNSLRVNLQGAVAGRRLRLLRRQGRRRREVRAALGHLRQEPRRGQALHGLGPVGDELGRGRSRTARSSPTASSARPMPAASAPRYGLCWDEKSDAGDHRRPGQRRSDAAAFRIQLSAGWPWWDALKGEVQDKVEVLTSARRQGSTPARASSTLNLRWKDIPINHMLPDDETAAGFLFDSGPAGPGRGPLRPLPDHAQADSDRQRSPGARLDPLRALRPAPRPARSVTRGIVACRSRESGEQPSLVSPSPSRGRARAGERARICELRPGAYPTPSSSIPVPPRTFGARADTGY